MPDQKKKVQKKVDFIKFIEFIEKKPSNAPITEYEVIGYTKFEGEGHCGPFSFVPWDISTKKQGETRKLILKIKLDLGFLPPEKREGYPFVDLIEIPLAIGSLVFRTLLKLGSIVREGDTPITVSKREDEYIDEELVLGTRSFRNLDNWFEQIRNLDTKYHEKFLKAVRSYSQALQLIEKAPDIAYLRLISAIEVLSGKYDIGEVDMSKINKKLANLLEELPEDHTREVIKDAILKLFRFHGRRFVKFIENHLTDEFWKHKYAFEPIHKKTLANFISMGYTPEIGKVTSEELPAFLKKVYEQRSKMLHEGEPFPRAIFSKNYFYEEIPSVFVFSYDNEGGRFQRDKDCPIPHVHFFERLVNHVLKNFVKQNQTSINK